MTGERDLKEMLRHMAPQLQTGIFVYCCFPDFCLPAGINPICTFRESEGLMAIVERSQADRADVPHVFEAKLITLRVHSSLEGIGFLAAVANVLAKACIPCNAVAAYHHDHLFVPTALADKAMTLLLAMTVSDSIESDVQVAS